jgi:hypothetical protein
MTIELNIRLDSHRGGNCHEHFALRKQVAFGYLGKYGETLHRRLAFWPGHTQLLILNVEADSIPHDALVELSLVMRQDCVSVFYPAKGTGELVGPKIAGYGDFDLDKFYRFDPALTTGNREAAYRPPKPPEPVDEKTKKKQLAALHERFNVVFPRHVLDRFAPQQINMTNSAINRVIDKEGMEALTIPRLEGIHELVTVHLWCDALTVAVATRDQEQLT